MNFKEIYSIDVTANVSTKGRFKYLSWAHAWKWFVEQYPTATYEVIKDEQGKCYFGDATVGYMVYTKVTVDKLTHEMWLPVMDHNNKTVLKPNMFQVNKTVMRCLVKNLAMFGLGLYIYAGEDLPNEEDDKPVNKPNYNKQQNNSTGPTSEAQVKRLNAIAYGKGYDFASVKNAAKKKYNVDDLTNLNKSQYDEMCKGYENAEKKNG